MAAPMAAKTARFGFVNLSGCHHLTNCRDRATVRDGVVAVEVGRERVKHFVHKALLEEHSEYFKKALSGPWKEAEEESVCLDDVKCSTCKFMVDIRL